MFLKQKNDTWWKPEQQKESNTLEKVITIITNM